MNVHYYPFGLSMLGISSKALKPNYAKNKFAFNGGNELQSKEFSDGTGLEEYDAVHRMYDPQLGRFWQIDELGEMLLSISPYNFASNNPINRNDPLGLKDTVVNGERMKRDPDVSTLVIRVKRSQQSFESIYWYLINNNIPIERVSNQALRNRLESFDRVQNWLNELHQQQREEEEQWLEYGSLLIPIPVGELRILGRIGGPLVKLFRLKRGIAAAEVGAEVAAKEGLALAKPLVPLGLGTTGRTVAKNLVEQMAMKNILENPALGRVIQEGMKDTRWPGWSKLQYTVTSQQEVKAVIHYVGKFEDGVLVAVDDFKFK